MQAPSDSQPGEARTPVNREAVKVLCKAVGVREGARRMGLSEERVMKWSQRDPEGPWSQQTDKQALSTPTNNGLTKQEAACPQPVRSASEALDSQLKDDSEQTKISLSRSIRRGSNALEKMADDVPFNKAKNVKELVGAASQLHGWEQQRQSNNLDINVLAGGRAMIQVVNNQVDKPTA